MNVEAHLHVQAQELASPSPEQDSVPPIASPFHATHASVEAPYVETAAGEAQFATAEAHEEPPPAPQPPPRPAAVPRPIPELPPVSLTLPPESGLELVETKSKPAPVSDQEPPVSAGPRRVRPPKVTVVEEPLQIVETHRPNSPG